MSQQGRLVDIASAMETLTGNTGGAITPDGAGNINVLGSAPITVTGNPGTFTLTISDDGTLATTYTADSGSATPAANNLNVLGATVSAGTTPISTIGAGSTVTINAQISQALVASDLTKVGLCNFDSSKFSVDANGFVSTPLTNTNSDYRKNFLLGGM